ncbi:MAG TPA: hypothetical protein PK230_06660, partial [Chitinophagales bacterium]|nr:hypothetical protein [Chitinophagales bacterium]
MFYSKNNYYTLATFVLFILYLSSSFSAKSQSYYNVWNNIQGFAYGGLIKDSNNSLYSSGIALTDNNDLGIFLNQINEQGILQQSKIILNNCYAGHSSMVCLNDNSVVLMKICSNIDNELILSIERFDSNLNLIWAKQVDTSLRSNFYFDATLLPSTNEIWIALSSDTYDNENESIETLTINEQGIITQQHTYQLPIFSSPIAALEVVRHIITTPDDNIVILASGIDSTDKTITVLFKIDAEGNLLWAKTFQTITDPLNDYLPSCIIANIDGSYTLGGTTEQGNTFVVHLNNNGIVDWGKTYQFETGNYAFLRLQRAVGGIGYVGIIFNYTNTSYWNMFCLDEQGNVCWNKRYNHNLWLRNIVPQNDGYLLPINQQYTNANGIEEAIMGIAKVDLEGNLEVGCKLDRLVALPATTNKNFMMTDLATIHILPTYVLTDNTPNIESLISTTTPYQCPPPPPIALFTASDSLMCANECVVVTDNSLNNPTEWHWIAEGATPAVYEGNNPPIFCYPNNGIFTISLVVSNDYGSDTLTQTITVATSNCAIMPATFSLSKDSICINNCITPEEINMPDNPNFSYIWQTDGSVPNEYIGTQTPLFCYEEPGNFVVQLLTTNGVDTVRVSHFISVLQMPINEIDTTICLGEIVSWRGRDLTTSGTYSDTTANADV